MSTRNVVGMHRWLIGCALLSGACVSGLLHASFSFYWALGGRWLLNTVGQEAVEFVANAPVAASAVLVLVGCVKVAVAITPLFANWGRLPWPRLARVVSAGAAVVLVLYGGSSTVVSWAVLSGWITVAGGYDRTAQLGHAALWDPLFLVWGLLLAGGLWLTRPRREG